MIDALRCPLCASPLSRTAATLRCPQNHTFDVNKHGYVHLGTGRKLPEGDTPAMVEARTRFLATGHYHPLATTLATLPALAALAVDHEPMARLDGVSAPQLHDQPGGTPLVVDLGAGTGYYLAGVLEGLPAAEGLAFDVSKAALRRAAKAHPRAGAVLADTWGTLPLADGRVDLLLNVFAPRNGREMRRVLRPDGLLAVVTPTGRHLAELREQLGLLAVDPAKSDRLAHELRDFVLHGERILEWPLALSEAEAEDLIAMGPNAFHVRARATGPVTCTVSVRIGLYRPRIA